MSEKICNTKPPSERRKLFPTNIKKNNSHFPKKLTLYRNSSAKSSNTMNKRSINFFNNNSITTRRDIHNSYDQNLLKEFWFQLSNNIIKNYETGKGTSIKGFGVFTFYESESNLENEKKIMKPIFIVSKEFLEFIKPGVFNKNSGFIPFIMEKNDSIVIKKINYNEIAVALNITQDECYQIIKKIINDMREQVKMNKLLEKELPGIGIILVKENIMGVKFNNKFTKRIQYINNKFSKLTLPKKNLYFRSESNKLNQSSCYINNYDKLLNKSLPGVIPIPPIKKESENLLEKTMKIKSNESDIKEEVKQENNKENSIWKNKSFLKVPTSKSFIFNNQEKNILNKKNAYINNNLSKEIQKAILANKGQLLRELKEYDRNINGFITRFEFARAFDKCNVHPQLSMEQIIELINSYVNDQDNIEYNKLLTIILKDIKHNLKLLSFPKIDNNDLYSSFNNKFRFGIKHKKLMDNELVLNKSKLLCLKKTSNNNINNEREKQEIKEEQNNNNNEFNINEYNNLRINISEVENEILSIKLIQDEIFIHKNQIKNSLKFEKFNNNDQEINYTDLLDLLRLYSITYPVDKILKILKFINIPNPQNFTLDLLDKKLKECKVSSSEMTNVEIEEALNNILLDNKLDLNNILFNQKQEITQNEFVYLLHDKTRYSKNILQSIFQKLSKNNSLLSSNNLLDITNNLKNNIGNIYNEEFYISSCKKILSKIKSLKITVDNYFTKLLRNNYARKKNTMNQIDFILSLQKEEFEPKFTEDQLKFIFDKMKNDKTGEIDRNDFKKAINREYNALNRIQDQIKKMKLTLDDISFRLEISCDDYYKDINYWEFKLKIKKIDSHYSSQFIESLYMELVGDLDKKINIKYLIDSLNVYQKNEFNKINNESFIKNFINNIRDNVDYHTLKSAFEKEDEHFSGKLLKSLFCGIIKKYTKEFTEEDLIKFIRLTKLTGNITHEVEYIKFINMVYYNPNLDAFLLSVNELSEVYTTEANKNLKNLISIINNTKFSDEDNINNNNDYINIDQLYLYINDRIKTKLEKTCNKLEEPITKTIICKFDVDSDGKISLDDLKSILQRYTNTDFFKYENDSQSLNINLFSNQILSDIEYRSIVKKIKEHMDIKKISELGLFKLLDENKDGFINNIEFNKNIKNIIELNPSLSDRFFNYLDGYKNGMVDLNTFLERFKEFKLDNIVENNTKTENYILKRIAKYLMENLNKLKEEEIFCLIDKDGDGVVSLEDFKYFVIKELGVFKSEINDFKLERVMQNISLSKNLNITFADISELITKIKLNQKPNSYYIDFKEIFKETNNMNLSISKKNKDWIIQLIEKLGLYISQKFDNVSNFFNLYGNLNENKLRFEDFNKFLEKNSECFDGFNPSKDEIMSVFTALDSQKKNYLTLEDLKKKLDIFDFFRKMHFDIKNFLFNNFQNNIDAFKYFLPSNITYSLTFPNERIQKGSNSVNKINKENKIVIKGLTIKQFYDGINNIFPGKYSNEILLKYIKKYFNIGVVEESKNENENIEHQLITFSKFTFLYYEFVCSDEDFNKGLKKINRIFTTRNSLLKSYTRKTIKIRQNNSTGCIDYKYNLFRGPNKILALHPENHLLEHQKSFLAHDKFITPFEKSPLNRIKRLISSSSDSNHIKNIQIFMNKFKNQDYICNEFQFKNLIRQLNIGLTNIEIEDIIKRIGKTNNGLINIKDFYKFISSKDKQKLKVENSILLILSEFKQLLYKYYSNPKLAFIFNNKSQANQIDFTKFKSIIIELYTKEEKPIPNFVVLKNCYNFIDLRKDGVIDLVEWCNVFGKVTGKLDLFQGLENKKGFKELKKWEMSDNVIDIYKDIYKNRKMISLRAKNLGFGSIIQEDILINILKENLSNYKLSNTQWKIIVEIGTKETKGFINFDYFLNIIESCVKK